MLDGLFEQFLQFYHMDIRVGFGFDVHQIAVDRPLWLGGIKVKDEQGLLGHSDADVLLHAICDALLGAAGLRDIGHYFPNTDENWKGADSKQLLAKVCSLIREQGWEISNIDATLGLDKPNLWGLNFQELESKQLPMRSWDMLEPCREQMPMRLH
jgi:2-C-methyl-D-erythritol 2,4-cyclodiphosphate synthase